MSGQEAGARSSLHAGTIEMTATGRFAEAARAVAYDPAVRQRWHSRSLSCCSRCLSWRLFRCGATPIWTRSAATSARRSITASWPKITVPSCPSIAAVTSSPNASRTSSCSTANRTSRGPRSSRPIHDEYRFRNPCEELQKLANGVPPAATTDYARYWHGYRIYLWPLLERFSLATVRLINALVILAAVVACYAGLRAVIGATAAAVLIVVLLSLTDLWLAWRISTHAISLAFILLGVAGFGLLHARWRNPYLAVAVAALCGATFNFLDILVNPPMMPMLLAFLVLAAPERPPGLGPPQPQPVGAGLLASLVALSWFGAYALTWLTKWGLAMWYSPSPVATWSEILRADHRATLRPRGEPPGRSWRSRSIPRSECSERRSSRSASSWSSCWRSRSIATSATAGRIRPPPFSDPDLAGPDPDRLVRTAQQPHPDSSALHLSQRVGGHRDRLCGGAAGERTADDAPATRCGPASNTAVTAMRASRARACRTPDKPTAGGGGCCCGGGRPAGHRDR